MKSKDPMLTMEALDDHEREAEKAGSGGVRHLNARDLQCDKLGFNNADLFVCLDGSGLVILLLMLIKKLHF